MSTKSTAVLSAAFPVELNRKLEVNPSKLKNATEVVKAYMTPLDEITLNKGTTSDKDAQLSSSMIYCSCCSAMNVNNTAHNHKGALANKDLDKQVGSGAEVPLPSDSQLIYDDVNEEVIFSKKLNLPDETRMLFPSETLDDDDRVDNQESLTLARDLLESLLDEAIECANKREQNLTVESSTSTTQLYSPSQYKPGIKTAEQIVDDALRAHQRAKPYPQLDGVAQTWKVTGKKSAIDRVLPPDVDEQVSMNMWQMEAKYRQSVRNLHKRVIDI